MYNVSNSSFFVLEILIVLLINWLIIVQVWWCATNVGKDMVKEAGNGIQRGMTSSVDGVVKELIIFKLFIKYPVSEFNEFELRLKSVENQFQLSAGLIL